MSPKPIEVHEAIDWRETGRAAARAASLRRPERMRLRAAELYESVRAAGADAFGDFLCGYAEGCGIAAMRAAIRDVAATAAGVLRDDGAPEIVIGVDAEGKPFCPHCGEPLDGSGE